MLPPTQVAVSPYYMGGHKHGEGDASGGGYVHRMHVENGRRDVHSNLSLLPPPLHYCLNVFSINLNLRTATTPMLGTNISEAPHKTQRRWSHPGSHSISCTNILSAWRCPFVPKHTRAF